MAKEIPQEKIDIYSESFKAEDLERADARYRKWRHKVDIRLASGKYEQ